MKENIDNYKKTSYYQVKNGISERWKYRIRYYDYKDTYIKLEKKHKKGRFFYGKRKYIRKIIFRK